MIIIQNFRDISVVISISSISIICSSLRVITDKTIPRTISTYQSARRRTISINRRRTINIYLSIIGESIVITCTSNMWFIIIDRWCSRLITICTTSCPKVKGNRLTRRVIQCPKIRTIKSYKRIIVITSSTGTEHRTHKYPTQNIHTIIVQTCVDRQIV